MISKITKNLGVGVSFLIKLQVSGLQRKAPIQLFSSEFWENFKDNFCIKHHRVAASQCLPAACTLSYQFRRVKCRRFYHEYISTWSVITKEFLKALIKCYYWGYGHLLKAVNSKQKEKRKENKKIFNFLKEQKLFFLPSNL